MSKQKIILIVEDEKALVKALQLKLSHEGFATDTAANGEEALAKVEKKTYNLMLLDLIMPKLDGFAVLESLRQQKNKIPVIVLTNLSQNEDEQKVKALGARAFLIKSNADMVHIVEEIKKLI